MDGLAPGPDFDHCLLETLKERVNNLTTEVSDVASNVLSMEEDESA